MNRRRFLKSSILWVPVAPAIVRAAVLPSHRHIAAPKPASGTLAPTAGYAGWWKADVGVLNTSSAPAADGDSVLTWPDQSGNGCTATGAATTYPVYKTNIKNGLPVVRFTASANALGLNAAGCAIAQDVPGLTIIAAFCNRADTTSESYILNFTIGTSGNGRSALGIAVLTTKKIVFGARRLDADSGDWTDGSTLVATTWYIYSAVLDYANATKTLYKNGSSDATDAVFQTAGNTSNTASQKAGIGGNGSGPSFTPNADIAELLVYKTALSSSDREATEAYLNARYAIY